MKGLRNAFQVCAAVLAWLGLLAPLGAQTITGSIVGSVVDSSNLPVAGAAVALRQMATGAERRIETDTLGNFAFTNLDPGEYAVTVRAQGFKSLERRGLMLSASATLPAGVLALEVGALAESITVTAQGQAVQTASSERSGVVTGEQVENLLTKSRNVMSLVALLPGVVDTADPDSLTRNWNLYVQGNRYDTNIVSIDGLALNAWGGGATADVVLSQDAIAEVRVLVGNYQAEYGLRSGANITLVGKSGSRQFHGLFSYFKRHEQFNANGFFLNRTGQPKARYRYNTWTYNIGGPIYIPGKFNRNRDKLFFFWNHEFWPLETSVSGMRTVPTEKERAGDFSQSLDLNDRLISISDPYTRQPFPGNVAPASRINPSGQALLKVFPAPNFLDRGTSKGNYNFIYTEPVSKPTRMSTLRIDYNINSNHRLSGSSYDYLNDQKGKIGLDTGSSNWPDFAKGYYFYGQDLLFRHTWVVSPRLINEAVVGFTRRPQKNKVFEEELSRIQRKAVGFTAGQLNPSLNPLDLLPLATFGGVPNPANLYLEARFPFWQNGHLLTLTDTVSRIMGVHTLKAGVNADLLRHHASAIGGQPFGNFDFGRSSVNPLDTNYAYSNAIVGVFNSYQESNLKPIMRYRQANVEWFVQDSWKAAARLTIDYGLRFCSISPLWDATGFMAGFTFDKFDPSRQVSLIEPVLVNRARMGYNPVTRQTTPEVQIGAVAAGSGDPWNGMVVVAENPDYPRGLFKRRLGLGPRFGFAYDVFGDAGTAIRGGFGVFYNRPSTRVYDPFTTQPPLVFTPTIYYGEIAKLTSSAGVIYPQSVASHDKEQKIATVMNFSVSVQQKLPYATVLDLAYSGSLGRHLFWTREMNAVPPGRRFDRAYQDPTRTGTALPAAFLTPIRGYTGITRYETAASSNYHSLQVSANRRFASRLQYGAAWTWSKAMDFTDLDTESISPFVPPRIWNYGLAGFDRTHILKLNWIWDVPGSPWSNAFGKALLNGWQVSGLASFVSGSPLAIGWSSTTSVDITGTPSQSARIVVTDNPVLPKSERTFSRNFRTDVFQMPAVGTFGNAAKTLIRGPGVNTWDIAVFKSFSIAERARAQFRCEMYNAFNHTQFSGLDTSARFDAQGRQVNARFGEFTSARPARTVQLGLRASF